MFSKFNKKSQILFALVSLLFWLVAVTTIHIISAQFIQKEALKVERVIEKNVALMRAKFEATIFMDTYLADSLATVVTIDPTFAIANWDNIASKLLSKALFVRNVGIAPDNVISKVYPLKGNEGAIGFDFKTNPQQLRTVLLAKNQQQVYIDGPLTLVQGGVGLIARYPIFSDYPLNEDYWGTVSVVLDYNKLIKHIGINEFENADIAFRRNDNRHVFLGNADVFNNPDIENTVMLPNGTWEMAAKYRLDNAEHIQFTKQVVYTIGYMIAVLLYSLIFIHFRNYRKVHKASLYDELTHLPNRRLAMSQLGQLVKSDDDGSFAVLNIDLNDFKLVNDQLGHEAGDELLKHIAHYLKLSVRTSDTVARFGGDEFIIILRHVSEAKNVEVVVEKIHQMFADNPLSWGKHKIEPSVSIGYALAQKETENVKHLLSEADHAMYKQKQKYKNKKHQFGI